MAAPPPGAAGGAYYAPPGGYPAPGGAGGPGGLVVGSTKMMGVPGMPPSPGVAGQPGAQPTVAPRTLVTHQHPLALSKDPGGWMCDQCRRNSDQNPGMYRYRCPKGCDFDLCGDCLQLQVQLNLGGGIALEEEEAAEEAIPAEVKEAYSALVPDEDGTLSKLKLITALARDTDLASLILPDVDCGSLMSNERSFDAADALFDSVAKGKTRITLADFALHFKSRDEVATKAKSKNQEMREIFDLIDADKSGSVSKLELIAAVQQNQAVDNFILPGMDSSGVMSDDAHFDRVDAIFEAIAHGRKRFCFTDFERYFGKMGSKPRLRTKTLDMSNRRRLRRIFIIGPGFGRELNPQQGRMLEASGYQVHWCVNLPNPESPNFPVAPYLDQIKAELDQVQPDVVGCASKGGVYIVGLWQRRYWTGPTLLINAHPTCQVLPQSMNIVLAHGSNDEVYTRNRAELEALIATGTENRCLLYYVANSGLLPSGQRSRIGDQHNMASLLVNDTLPRLVDCALCGDGPEVHLVRSWRERLTDARLDAEASLGYVPEQLKGRWVSAHQRGREEQKLFDLAPDSPEYKSVMAVFKAHPKETPAYYLAPESVWDNTRVAKIQRVENGFQEEGCVRPYYETLRSSLEDQKIEFEPGTHSVWGFHGTADRGAIESIVTNPVAGFQPLASGTRGASLWGSGTYFARDASYVAHGGFCGAPAQDGTRVMLMCLLATGIPCLGDPNHKGVLPFRNKPHRYNCSVDSLSSPEIFIIPHPGAAYPAYLITFYP